MLGLLVLRDESQEVECCSLGPYFVLIFMLYCSQFCIVGSAFVFQTSKCEHPNRYFFIFSAKEQQLFLVYAL